MKDTDSSKAEAKTSKKKTKPIAKKAAKTSQKTKKSGNFKRKADQKNSSSKPTTAKGVAANARTASNQAAT